MAVSNNQSQGKTRKCPKCKEDIQIGAKKCKHCGSDLRNWFSRHKIITGILILFIIYIAMDNNQKYSNSSGKINSETIQEKTLHGTLAQRNAVRKARTYLTIGGFSRSGLIKQLEFEGFDHEDATYAVNNIDADWYKQAVRKARTYLTIGGFSRSGLMIQLESEGFTKEQTIWAVNKIGLN